MTDLQIIVVLLWAAILRVLRLMILVFYVVMFAAGSVFVYDQLASLDLGGPP